MTSKTIMGTDWDGNPTIRGIAPGFRIALRGEYGQGFDVRGPHASMCPECGHVSYVETAGALTGVIQGHYATVHGYTPALLPHYSRKEIEQWQSTLHTGLVEETTPFRPRRIIQNGLIPSPLSRKNCGGVGTQTCITL